MRRRTLILLALLPWIGLAGCDFLASSSSTISIHTDQSNYAVDSAPEVTLVNETDQSIKLLSCGDRIAFVIQKQAKDGWKDYSSPICLAIYIIGYETEVNDGDQWLTQRIAEPGTYRISQELKQGSAEPQVVFSNEFSVE